jgi:cob(I)alamin adenosyltransferase
MTPVNSHTGDDGFTGILGEGRVPKHHPRLEALGSIDEASAALGMARASVKMKLTADVLLTIQRDLYKMMAEIAASPDNAERFRAINEDRVSWIEAQIEYFSDFVELPQEFTLPGNTPASATLDLARTIVRRAERRITELLHHNEIANKNLLSYLNRVSTLCYILEGVENAAAGQDQYTLAKE